MKTEEEIKDGLAVILMQELSDYHGEVLKLEDFYRIAKKQAEWLKNEKVIKSRNTFG